MAIVPCISEDDDVACILAGACGLTATMRRALRAFLAERDSVTIADLAGLRRLAARLKVA